MAPPITPADMIPAGERIPGTLAQAAAPMTAANAKCRMVPATTCPAETGMAFITIARADGLIMDIRLAVVELRALPLISRPIWLTVAAGTCMPISIAPSLCIIIGADVPAAHRCHQRPAADGGR